MIDWILENKEWLLSGVLITVPIFIFSIMKDRSAHEGQIIIRQRAGRNASIKMRKSTFTKIDQKAVSDTKTEIMSEGNKDA